MPTKLPPTRLDSEGLISDRSPRNQRYMVGQSASAKILPWELRKNNGLTLVQIHPLHLVLFRPRVQFTIGSSDLLIGR